MYKWFARSLMSIVALSLPLASVAYAEPDDPEGRIRAAGKITAVNPGANTFSLETRAGDELTFLVTEETKFHSREGAIDGLEDLEPGMVALVVAIERDGQLVARRVAAGHREERPDLNKSVGEITGVVPGQGTFSLKTREGEELTFQTNERTRFRSRDGSVTGIHDLKKGMKAIVGWVRTEDGQLLALIVGAGQPKERPEVDVRAIGKIVSLGHNEFTIEKRDGGQMTFQVSGTTVFKSRDGSVDSFDDLQVGMIAVVGAKELGGDQLMAVWVGAGQPRGERRGDRPEGAPERSPAPQPEPAPADA